MSVHQLAQSAFEAGGGILRLAPTWVPRSFCIPGRRIRLHPDDLYAFGGNRGGIDERWLSSTTDAANGPMTSPNEGQSRIIFSHNGTSEFVLLKEAVEELKADLVGSRIWNEFHRWPVYSKLFDNLGPLPHHVHHRDQHASLVNQVGKPEAYFFPAQLNNHGGTFPYTFFGLYPGVTQEQIAHCLRNFEKGDNHITSFSQAHRLEIGTGWDVPPGILHAPGSFCTYEPQIASDVFAMYQSLVDNTIVPPELLWKDVPFDRHGDIDFLLEILDWDANVDPNFASNHFMRPIPTSAPQDARNNGYLEQWICYKSPAYSAKELTVFPNAEVVVEDAAAYGLIILQGYGTLGTWSIESAQLIRFGQLTQDEYFVSEAAARAGVRIRNLSSIEPIVMLKHFGPRNPDLQMQSALLRN